MRIFSLRLRLTLLLAVATLIAMGLAAWVVDRRADAEMQQRFDTALLTRAQAFAALARSAHGHVQLEAGAASGDLFPGAVGMEWYALVCGGETIARSAQPPPALRAGSEPRFVDAPMQNRTVREVALRFHPAADDDTREQTASPMCELRYALDHGALDEILDALDWILLGSIFGACLIVLALTPWLVRRGLRPLSSLSDAMARIGPDTPGARLLDAQTRELVPVVTRFNGVLARMDEGLARERRFASGLAHELRTRLAELRALIDVETRYASGRDVHLLLSEIGKIGGELEATVGALLQLTRIESGVQTAQRERLDPDALLTRTLARHSETLRARGLSMQREVAAGDLRIDGDATLLEIVLDNLLGNAIVYAPPCSAVRVRCMREMLVIDNAAPDLREEDIRRFGQRFWRKHGGEGGAGHAGLGLALASAAAQAMGMRLEFALCEGRLHAALHWS